MADGSTIEWTDATWNPVTGCSVVSPGCTNCYAMKLAGTRMKHHPSRQGLTVPSKAGPVWNGKVRLNEEWLDQPLRWKRPRRIFVCAHGDLFHENVPDTWIDIVFAAMALAPQHTFQVLTKRPDRMRAYMTEDGIGRVGYVEGLAKRMLRERSRDPHKPVLVGKTLRWPLPNVWLGVSAEDQQRADERIPLLVDTPAAVRFVSAEPLLGPIDLRSTKGGTLWIGGQRGCEGRHHGIGTPECPRELHHHHDERCNPGLDWVIAGGESGPGARPMHPDWARSLRDQCAAAGVPFFFKQVGEWAFDVSPHIPVPMERLAWVRDDGKVASADEVDRVERRGGQQNWKQIARVGKKAAGALLDGREWREFPNG